MDSKTTQILDLLAQMKKEARSQAQRLLYDRLAIEIMTTEIEPLKMADNLKYWLDLHAA